MKKFPIIFAFYIFSLCCASTSITSIKNSSLEYRIFSGILIIAPFSDLQMQREFENEFASIFYSIKVDAFTGQEVIPPIKNYNEQELNKILNSYSIDGIIVVSFVDYFNTETYIPPSSKTTGTASIIGNYLYYKQQTQYYGGYNIIKPNMKFEIRLYDRKSGEIAWRATSLTRGNAFADINDLVSSLARTTIKMLLEDGILMKTSARH